MAVLQIKKERVADNTDTPVATAPSGEGLQQTPIDESLTNKQVSHSRTPGVKVVLPTSRGFYNYRVRISVRHPEQTKCNDL